MLIFLSIKEPKLLLTSPENKEKPDFYFEKVKITQLEKGKATIIINADYAELDKKKQQTLLKGMQAQFKKQDKLYFNVQAPLAIFIQNQEQLIIKQPRADVLLEKDTFHIRAKNLKWNGLKQHLTATGNLVVTSNLMNLKGNKLFINVPSKNLQIKGTVHALLN
jgi:LPS export ABC transporter protein LptC